MFYNPDKIISLNGGAATRRFQAPIFVVLHLGQITWGNLYRLKECQNQMSSFFIRSKRRHEISLSYQSSCTVFSFVILYITGVSCAMYIKIHTLRSCGSFGAQGQPYSGF